MRRTIAVVVAGLTCACAAHTTAGGAVEPPGLASHESSLARCAAVADSVRASTSTRDLPLAVPRGRPVIPLPHSGVTGEVQTIFLVDPAGKAVQGTVVTTGASDPEFRRDMEEMILRTPFRPPVVSGCSSWGHAEFRLRREIIPR